MNKFEEKFFWRYIPEWQEIKLVVHKHYIDILWNIVIWLSIAIIPSFLYYYSISIKTFIPLYFLEIFLIVIYIKVIYDIFDWYNDAWIVSNESITDLGWSLFKSKMNNVNFNNVEWFWVEQDWIIDKILNKWDMIVHKIWDDEFVLKNVFKPYFQLDKIEELNWEINSDEFSPADKKFNVMVDTFWWILEKYLGIQWTPKKDDKSNKEVIKKFEDEKWTIDLRD